MLGADAVWPAVLKPGETAASAPGPAAVSTPATQPPAAERVPFADLAPAVVKQPLAGGWPVEPPALEQTVGGNSLGDSRASLERYFELMDRKSLTPEPVR